MIGIAFSGGGLRGSYEIGAFMAFKKCHIKIDGFVGTSIGAFNAAMLASNLDKELLNFWAYLDAGKILGFTDNLSKEINDNKIDIPLIKEVAINIWKILENKGISTKGLREVVESYNLKEKLYKSKKDFGLVTVRLKSFKPVYMFKEQINPDKLTDYLMASCYLPIFKLEKIIDDNYYLDGGFHDNIPANSLLEKGYSKVYVIDLEAIGIKRPYNDKEKVTIIKPSRKLGSILNIKSEDIKRNINIGYYDTLKVLKKLDGFKYIFKVKNDRYYNRMLKKVNAKELQEMRKLFSTQDPKRLILKALEYIMKKEDFTYFKIYNVKYVIKEIKHSKKNYGVYKFIKKLGG